MTSDPLKKQVDHQRRHLLMRISSVLDAPMTFLGLLWVVLLVVDLTRGLSPWLELANHVIWGLFIAHFALEFIIAPKKLQYLRSNWLTAVALVLPALRVLRIVRALRILRMARLARSMRLLRLLTSLNRGMRALQKTARQQGIGYVVALTVLINFAGAAGIYHFENPAALRNEGLSATGGHSIGSYGEAVWWTAMMLTTMGSEYWPQTTEGRLLGWLLALYAFAIFGYITAALANLFLRGSAEERRKRQTDQQLATQLVEVRTELERLRHLLIQRGIENGGA